MLAALLATSGIAHATETSAWDREVNRRVTVILTLSLRINRGDVPSDQWVREARLGEIEPLMLSWVRLQRSYEAVDLLYRARFRALDPEALVTSQALSTAESRRQLRSDLATSGKLLRQYDIQILEILASAEKGTRAAFAAMSREVPLTEESALLWVEHLRELTLDYVEVESDRISEALSLVTVLDEHPKAFWADPEKHLQFKFSDAELQARYNVQLARMNAASARLEQLRRSEDERRAREEKRRTLQLRELAGAE